MASRQDAYNQYNQYLQSVGGHANSDTEGDFNNLWNQSAEAGLYSGAGYGKSWDQLFQGYQPTLQSRWQGAAGQHQYTDATDPTYAARNGGQQAAGAGTQTQQAQPPDWYKGYMDTFLKRQQEQDALNKSRGDQMWSAWQARANQPLVDRNDPIVRAQADANSANETRAQRNYLADIAESEGPNANLRGETRMAAERLGQRTGGFEAELLGRRLQSQRDEQAQALAAMSGMLNGDQMREAQGRLAAMDQAIREQGLGLQQQGLNQDWQRALLQNDQFMGDLGLRAEDRASYWDALRRGQIYS